MLCGLCCLVFCSNEQEHSKWHWEGGQPGVGVGVFSRVGSVGSVRLPLSPRPPPAPIHRAGGFVSRTRVSFKAIAFSGGCLKHNVIGRLFTHTLVLTSSWFARACPLSMVPLNPGCPVPQFPPPVTQGGRMVVPPRSSLGNSSTISVPLLAAAPCTEKWPAASAV